MADMTSGLVGFLLSTVFIVIFGEIIPQACCSRYALTIGSKAIPIVKVIMFFLYPMTKPIAVILDKALGEEIGTIHNKKQLLKLLTIHVEHDAIDAEEGKVMSGAIQYSDKIVMDCMTPIADVYMLPVEAKLDFKTISNIFKTGFSRIPIFKTNRNNIVGVLFTKDLILIDPQDKLPVRSVIQFFKRSLETVWFDSKLNGVLTTFKNGVSHLALVKNVNSEGEGDPFYENVGIITMEDILEEILGEEIVDETDGQVDRTNFDYNSLRLLDKSDNRNDLSEEEISAVSGHLLTNVKLFKENKKESGESINYEDIAELVRNSRVLELERDQNPTARRNMVYQSGKMDTHCTLILSGKIKILAGREAFECEAGPWRVLAAEALVEEEGTYVPDFSATLMEDVRCLRIARHDFLHLLNPDADKEVTHAQRRHSVASTSGREHKDNVKVHITTVAADEIEDNGTLPEAIDITVSDSLAALNGEHNEQQPLTPSSDDNAPSTTSNATSN
eukprot:TRINITY_DN2879_c0_g1_i2.p1 TRINITY_DN2879_c0_g1~~TRINITY_DN2879_c0_g1_i2.p1  ORF type:complete len:503 (+),score=170.14 TRINITY_DN2879_c0_g1_i2:400-1908(+)